MANSLFEDNAEFGLGFRLTVDQHRQRVMRLLSEFADKLPAELNAALHAEATPEVRREQVAALRQALAGVAGAEELLTDADALVEKSVWLIGGDGWAYDIGFGGRTMEPDWCWTLSVTPTPAGRRQPPAGSSD